ncbi:hypothetical protein TNCV_424931 [Trichonephila clavipes]|nr:hypothetical protein TNCV_424931 [Trichonephila clavipes]
MQDLRATGFYGNQAKMWVGMGHIAIRTRRVNFKTHHMPLSLSMRNLARVVSSCALLIPSKAAPGWFPSHHSCTGPASKRN